MKDFIKNFRNLDLVHRSLVYLMQTYFIGTIISSIFINIYVFKYFGNINGLIIFNSLVYFFSFIGFALVGIIISRLKLNIKYGYKIAYILFIIAFLLLLFFKNSFIIMYIFSILYGLGNGSYWCANHSYELSQVIKDKRDFYSSSVTIGKNFFTIFFPLFISLIFLLSEKFIHFNTYNFIFILLPIIYITSFIFIRKLPEYYPQKVKTKDIFKNLHPKEIYQNLFFLFSVQTSSVPKIVILIVTIYLLKTEINIGIFQSIIGLISIIITALLSTKRNETNRLKIMFIFSVLVFINYLILGLNISFIGLIFFTIINYIISPGFDISVTVFSMKYMGDLKKDHTMFLPKIIFRELVLIIGRLSFFLPFFIIINYYDFSLEQIMRYAIIYSGMIYLLSVIFVYLEEKRLKFLTQ